MAGRDIGPRSGVVEVSDVTRHSRRNLSPVTSDKRCGHPVDGVGASRLGDPRSRHVVIDSTLGEPVRHLVCGLVIARVCDEREERIVLLRVVRPHGPQGVRVPSLCGLRVAPLHPLVGAAEINLRLGNLIGGKSLATLGSVGVESRGVRRRLVPVEGRGATALLAKVAVRLDLALDLGHASATSTGLRLGDLLGHHAVALASGDSSCLPLGGILVRIDLLVADESLGLPEAVDVVGLPQRLALRQRLGAALDGDRVAAGSRASRVAALQRRIEFERGSPSRSSERRIAGVRQRLLGVGPRLLGAAQRLAGIADVFLLVPLALSLEFLADRVLGTIRHVGLVVAALRRCRLLAGVEPLGSIALGVIAAARRSTLDGVVELISPQAVLLDEPVADDLPILGRQSLERGPPLVRAHHVADLFGRGATPVGVPQRCPLLASACAHGTREVRPDVLLDVLRCALRPTHVSCPSS